MGCCSSKSDEDEYGEPQLRKTLLSDDLEDLLSSSISKPSNNREPKDLENNNNSTPKRKGSFFDDLDAGSPSTNHIVKRGWADKLGHKRKNWTKRYFLLSNGVLSYYSGSLDAYPFSTGYKGHIALKNAAVTTFIGKNMKLAIKITNATEENNSGKADLDVKAESDEETKSWAKAIAKEVDKTGGDTSRQMENLADGKLRTSSSMSSNGSIKARSKSIMQSGTGVLKQGWGKKKGSLVKNWKKRFFVLADGWLSYYAKGPPHVSDRKGQLPLDGCFVEVKEYKRTIHVRSTVQKRTLIIEFETEAEAEEWADHLDAGVEEIGTIRIGR